MKPVLMRDKTNEVYGVTLYRLYWPGEDREGGWAANSVVWSDNCNAKIYDDALIFGGTIWGGSIMGGSIRGGTIEGGTIWDGTIMGGTIKGGTIWGGTIWGGSIWGGTIKGGTIEGGTICGGTIMGGTHTQSPAMAQRSDGYCFIVHPVDGELWVWAGCRDFSWVEAVEHWGKEDHPQREESMRIIHFLRAQIEAREGTYD